MSDAEQPKSGNALDTLRARCEFCCADVDGGWDARPDAAVPLARVAAVIEAARPFSIDAPWVGGSEEYHRRKLAAALRAVDEGEAR